jgi:hypothetical protein
VRCTAHGHAVRCFAEFALLHRIPGRTTYPNNRQMLFPVGEIIRWIADKSMRNSFSMQASGRILSWDWR